MNVNIDKFIKKLVNDTTISESSWEKRYQHLRDDLCLVQKGELSFEECVRFHNRVHNINVIGLANRYNALY